MQLPTSIMKDQPSVLFRRDRSFYLWYDGTYLVLLLGLIAALAVSGWQGVNLRWGPGLIPWFLAACYIQILSSVFIHNCTHGNFPRPMNRWIGELTGLIVFTRYASWEILHHRHHKYAENRDKDPHPAIPGFWNFLYHTMGINLERNLHQQFYELHGGETPENVEFDRRRSWLSYLTMAVLAWAWWALLGTVAFWAIYAPSAVVGLVHISHFNWRTHNGQSADRDYKPVNIDSGIYWLGNRLCFGLYMHANHHRHVGLFNPMHYGRLQAKR